VLPTAAVWLDTWPRECRRRGVLERRLERELIGVVEASSQMKRLCTVATPSLSAEIVALTDGGVFVEGQT
jgi:hypothetical protein